MRTVKKTFSLCLGYRRLLRRMSLGIKSMKGGEELLEGKEAGCEQGDSMSMDTDVWTKQVWRVVTDEVDEMGRNWGIWISSVWKLLRVYTQRSGMITPEFWIFDGRGAGGNQRQQIVRPIWGFMQQPRQNVQETGILKVPVGTDIEGRAGECSEVSGPRQWLLWGWRGNVDLL